MLAVGGKLETCHKVMRTGDCDDTGVAVSHGRECEDRRADCRGGCRSAVDEIAAVHVAALRVASMRHMDAMDHAVGGLAGVREFRFRPRFR